jgi:hypothetical protein
MLAVQASEFVIVYNVVDEFALPHITSRRRRRRFATAKTPTASSKMFEATIPNSRALAIAKRGLELGETN